MMGRESTNAIVHAAGGYGPPGGGGGYGGPPPGGAPPGGGGYGGPPQGGGYGGPPAGGYGGGGGFGSPPGGYGGGFGGGGGGGFGPPGGGFAPPGGPMGPGMGDDINTTLPLALSIVAMLCCWGSGIGFILGVVGLVFSIQSGNAKKTGDMETARNKAKTALTVSIIALVLGFLGNGVIGFLRYNN